MDRHIQDRGAPNTPSPVCSGKAHQLRQAWMCRQEAPPAASCAQAPCGTQKAQGPAAPPTGIAEPLELRQDQSPSSRLKTELSFGWAWGRPRNWSRRPGQEVGWNSQTRGGGTQWPILAQILVRRRCRLEGNQREGIAARKHGDPLFDLPPWLAALRPALASLLEGNWHPAGRRGGRPRLPGRCGPTPGPCSQAWPARPLRWPSTA